MGSDGAETVSMYVGSLTDRPQSGVFRCTREGYYGYSVSVEIIGC